MYKRPTANETEEDILRMQDEFLKNKAENKIKPAATVVSSKKGNEPSESKVKEDVNMVDVSEQLANTFEAIPTNINLGCVVEKQSRTSISQIKFSSNRGFPQAKRRDPTLSTSNGSIFSLQMKRKKLSEENMEVDNNSSPSVSTIKENMPVESVNKQIIKLLSESTILTGSDSKQIHEENVKLLSNMSEQEILEERERLLETMDPAIIQFLRSRRREEKVVNLNPTIKEQNEAAEMVSIEEIETSSELLSQPLAEKWLNFDVVECNKLAWMKNMDIPKIEKNKQFEARFDFEGWLLPYSEPEITEKNRALYHHGEEPGRPGYTLQELFQLSRSTVTQQKIIALNAIANILSLHSTGVYDDIIDIPLEQIFFVIRFCLDDNSPAVLNASVKAMRNLIFYHIDETCLDSLLGFGIGQIQPVLACDHENEDDNTVNDQQLAETNLVKCVARTEILTRIRYIINTVKPTLETIVHCMDILIRLSRDSFFVMNKVKTCDGLIDSIIKNFVSKEINYENKNSPYGTPLLQAVKLLRILSARSKDFAVEFINKYKLMDSICVYLSSEAFLKNSNGLKLQTECFHLFSTFVSYGLSIDYFNVLQPILLGLLDYHCKNTNLDMSTTYIKQGHLGGLLVLLGEVAKKQYSVINPYLSLLEYGANKWTIQFSTLEQFACGKLQIISSLLYCFENLVKYQPIPEQFSVQKINSAVLNMVKSKGFNVVTQTISNGSMLLNNYETHKTSNNLKTVEASAWYTIEHVVPILQTTSCLPFLCALSSYVDVSTNYEMKKALLSHPNIHQYLLKLKSEPRYYLTSNWFTRIESAFLLNILKSSVIIQKDVDTSIFYELSVKCLSVFNSEQKPEIEYLLNQIIFCPKFYPSHVLLQNLDISSTRSNNLETSLNNLEDILKVYTQVLGLKLNIPDFRTCACLDVSIGNVIPVDWIYTPIIVLYSNQQQNKSTMSEEQQMFIIKNCLRWIVIYETYFPVLASSINATDRFCRIACVFLGSDSLFLNQEIHSLLEICLRNIMEKCENDLNFDKEIQGLNNFQDFYTQLLEQYQGVSYGDILFGNFILVPLAQRHSKQWKKTLWSEYLGVVQILNVTEEQTVCTFDTFLYPPEDDMSILKSYRRALVNNTIRKNTALHKIANHHVEQFILKRKSDKE